MSGREQHVILPDKCAAHRLSKPQALPKDSYRIILSHVECCCFGKLIWILIICRTSSGKSKSTELVATENCQMNPEKEARNDTQSKSKDASALYGQVQKARGHNPDSKSMTSSNQSRSDDSSTHYASVKEVKGLDHDSQVTHPVNQGPVYADIGFEQSRI